VGALRFRKGRGRQPVCGEGASLEGWGDPPGSNGRRGMEHRWTIIFSAFILEAEGVVFAVSTILTIVACLDCHIGSTASASRICVGILYSEV